jgi:hypothetical protein
MENLPADLIDEECAIKISPKAILNNLIELDQSFESIDPSVDTLLERCFDQPKET